MSDEDDLTEDDDLTEGGEAAAPSGTKKPGRGLDAMAMRTLRSAHKLFKEGDSSATEANFLVASANVLATLDLASAVRNASGVASDDGELPLETPRKQPRRRR